jgi:ComF family protein
MLRWLVPEACPGCGDRTPAGFCDACRSSFAASVDPCPGCGLARPVAACPRALGDWSLSGVIAPFVYSPPLDNHLQALKFSGRRHLGRALGLLVVDAPGVDRALTADALVPVPLHRRRLLERGYNQAVEIARAIARERRLPLLLAGVRRIRATPPQAGQGAHARRSNLDGAFVVAAKVTGLRLAIVDDVMTTGATANALAAALESAGAAEVVALTVARTPAPLQATGAVRNV